MTRVWVWAWVVASLAIGAVAWADENADREALRVEIEQLRESGKLHVRGVDIAAGDLVAELYERRSFSPAWSDVGQVGELVALIEGMYEEGLDPADYSLAEAQRAHHELSSGRPLTPRVRAAFDLVLTDSLIRVGYHLQFGKINPLNLDTTWNFGRELAGDDPVAVVQRAIDSESLQKFAAERFPRGPLYILWRRALREYRVLATTGGWSRIEDSSTLKPGAEDPRVATLARRLAITGDLEETVDVDSSVYSGALEKGVRRFQERHGLDVDGVVGPATWQALNVPIEDRIEQLRVNMERARWVTYGLEDDFIIVNIAGFRAYVVRGNEIAWETKVQVGAPYHKTPVFRGELKYLVFNPTWTVPYSIATKEMLPRIRSDPDYFRNRDFDVRDRAGDTIDPATVDWSAATRRNFAYTFVQRAGPGNALGRVKFIFPNKYSVFLHDTPSKALFDRSERAFSHGCIRVENPFELAEILLGPEGWDRARMDALTTTTTVYLPKPLPVLLLYWTAGVAQDGTLQFLNDIYDRDEPIARALEAPFTIELPEARDGLEN